MGSDCAPIDAQMHRVLALSFSGVLFGDSWIGEVHNELSDGGSIRISTKFNTPFIK